MPDPLKFDRAAFKAMSHEEADNHVEYWEDKLVKERAEAAWFLIKHAYGVDDNIRMDRTVFEKRKR